MVIDKKYGLSLNHFIFHCIKYQRWDAYYLYELKEPDQVNMFHRPFSETGVVISSINGGPSPWAFRASIDTT